MRWVKESLTACESVAGRRRPRARESLMVWEPGCEGSQTNDWKRAEGKDRQGREERGWREPRGWEKETQERASDDSNIDHFSSLVLLPPARPAISSRTPAARPHVAVSAATDPSSPRSLPDPLPLVPDRPGPATLSSATSVVRFAGLTVARPTGRSSESPYLSYLRACLDPRTSKLHRIPDQHCASSTVLPI